MKLTRFALVALLLLAGCSAAPQGPARVDYIGAVSSLGIVSYESPDGTVEEVLPASGPWAHSRTADPGTVLTVVVGDKRRAGAWCSITVNGKTVAEDSDPFIARCTYTVPA